MPGKSFQEDRAFRLVGLVIMAGLFGAEVFTHLRPYLHPTDDLAITIGLISGAFHIAFFAWMIIFAWRLWRGDYQAEIEEQRARSRPPSARFSILFWVAVAAVLVFAFNIIPDVVKDSHIAGLICTVGPLVLLFVVWIGFWLWMRRNMKN